MAVWHTNATIMVALLHWLLSLLLLLILLLVLLVALLAVLVVIHFYSGDSRS